MSEIPGNKPEAAPRPVAGVEPVGAKRRGEAWYGSNDVASFIHRAFTKAMGYDDADLQRPIIGICNTWSELNHCNSGLKDVAEAVNRGGLQECGLPLEFPTISIGEVFVSPTSMLFRNLAAMDTEEMIRAQPLDGVVLLAACDKTTPAQLMGAASADVPALMITGAPIPAPDSRRLRFAEASGRQIVRLAREGIRPSQIMTRGAFENAIRVLHAVGGSTNAVVHLPAIAGRLGIELELDLFDALSRTTPWLANLRPSGKFQMEQLFEVGGVPAVMKELEPLLNKECLTVTGLTLGENLSQIQAISQRAPASQRRTREVIAARDEPLDPEGGLAILRGNLCPDGAVIKHVAASPHLLTHRGPALVFSSVADLAARIDDPDLAVTPDHVLVLQNTGPVGAPGMPEVGNLPIPKKLLAQGVRDMVRISDARMSGTSYGTIVLHVAPESAVGGPLAAVRTGDEIEIDVPNRQLNVLVPREEIDRRLAAYQRPPQRYARGWTALHLAHVRQADEGCDFDVL